MKNWKRELKYSQVWEDTENLMKALQIKSGGRYLSIASAGDNAIVMLAYDPAEVVAVDMNPVQLYCSELKRESFRVLSYKEMLQFWGYHDCFNRQLLYERVAPFLSESCRKYWDGRGNAIDKGFCRVGRLDEHIEGFSQYLLENFQNYEKIQEYMEKSVFARKKCYGEWFRDMGWEELIRDYFSTERMSGTARDPAYYRYMKSSVEEQLVQRLCYTLTETNIIDNPYLRFFLFGNYQDIFPLIADFRYYEKIKKNIDKLNFRQGSLEECLKEEEKYDGFNLSDIFEYLSLKESEKLFEEISEHANHHARVAYWNMMVDRDMSMVSEEVKDLPELSAELYKEDRSIFYRNFLIHEF